MKYLHYVLFSFHNSSDCVVSEKAMLFKQIIKLFDFSKNILGYVRRTLYSQNLEGSCLSSHAKWVWIRLYN